MKLINILRASGMTLAFVPFITFGQTTIDYIYAPETTISTSACNVFASVVTYKTFENQTTLGFPTFENTSFTVKLQCAKNNDEYSKSTQYQIKFKFKKGFKYSIAAYGKTNLLGSSGANIGFAFSENGNDPNTSTTCTGPQNFAANARINYGEKGFSENFAWLTDVVKDAVMSKDYNYLIVAAFPSPIVTSTEILTLSLQKIQITETPPAASFVISPASIPIACGTNTAKTFTIANGSGTTGITNYTWNLGANNGWLYNGVPAGANVSTGTNNTIILTPACGAAQSNVTATVTANAVAYPTNIATVTITQPSLSINGPATFCGTQQTYSINGLPCNTPVVWSLSPATGVANLSCTNCTQTTLTKTANGNVTLTAKVTSCGMEQTLTLPVHVGAYTSSDYSISGNNGSVYFCPDKSINFSLSGGTGTNYNWTWPTGWSYIYGQGGPYVAVKTAAGSYPPTGNIAVGFTEPCGTQISVTKFLIYNNNGCGPTPYTITPNPATSTITIACASLQTYCNIAAVQITSISNSNVISSQTWQNTNTQVQMPISFLQPGNYIARIYNGTQWYSMQFIKQ